MELEDPSEDAPDKVVLWRVRELRRVGFNDLQAEALAASSCDLHEAVHLMTDLHCPAEIAFDILS